MKETICDILGISQASYYRWKQERPIINLLEKYFDEKDLKQFIVEGKMDKLEIMKVKDTTLDEFFLSNLMHKLIIKSTLPLDANDNAIVKILKAILNKNKHYSILPLETFLTILNDQLIHDKQTLIDGVSKADIMDNWKNIIIKFCKYELSVLEINAMIENKTKITDFFENEKLDKNCMLNFS